MKAFSEKAPKFAGYKRIRKVVMEFQGYLHLYFKPEISSFLLILTTGLVTLRFKNIIPYFYDYFLPLPHKSL